MCDLIICDIVNDITGLINDVFVPLLMAIAFIVFLYGVASKYILSNGDPDKVSEGHKLILWGLIGFVVILSVWGLVYVVSNTLGLEGFDPPLRPVSYY
jgi:hypothetical protein